MALNVLQYKNKSYELLQKYISMFLTEIYVFDKHLPKMSDLVVYTTKIL